VHGGAANREARFCIKKAVGSIDFANERTGLEGWCVRKRLKDRHVLFQ